MSAEELRPDSILRSPYSDEQGNNYIVTSYKLGSRVLSQAELDAEIEKQRQAEASKNNTDGLAASSD